jgi:hypothetical protein
VEPETDIDQAHGQLTALIEDAVDPEILEIIDLCNSLAAESQPEYEVITTAGGTSYASESRHPEADHPAEESVSGYCSAALSQAAP